MTTIKNNRFDFSTNVKVAIAIVVSIVIAIVLYLLMTLVVKDKQVLFSELTDNDAASIVDGLKSLKVDYQLSEDGKAILIEHGKVHETRLNLMSSGVLLNHTVGLELFDKADYGMTEFAQKVNFQRALQGEISRTITGLTEIKFARVHLTLPKNSIFADQRKEAKASINIITEDGFSLSKDQVIGIQRLVAASIAGLSEKSVVIVDEWGRDISIRNEDPFNSNDQFAGTAILEKKRAYESHLTGKVENILVRLIKKNHYAVSVDVTFDYSKTTFLEENLIQPSNHINGYLKNQKVNTKYAKGGNDKSLIAKKETEERSTEYQFGKAIKQIENIAGGIKSISVAVLVTASLSDEDIANLKDIISAAVGLNFQRGDVINMHRINSHLVKSDRIEELSTQPLITGAIEPVLNQPNPLLKNIGEIQIDLQFLIAGLVLLAIFLALFFLAQLQRRNKRRNLLLNDLHSWINNEEVNKKEASVSV